MHFPLCVTIDVDPDDSTLESPSDSLKWQSLELLPDIRNCCVEVGGVPTWFLRSDDRIASQHDSYAFLLRSKQKFWEHALSEGDELGVHPHFCHYDASTRSYTRLRDAVLCCEQLNRVHDSLRTEGLSPSSIRVGESFHSSHLMRCINDLGYLVDSTGLPGRYRSDEDRHFDWIGTPNAPYRPSREDYRIPATEKRDALNVLEAPMTTMLFKADFDDAPKLRYTSLAYRTDIFEAGMRRHLEEPAHSAPQPIVFIVHPGELDARVATQRHASMYSFEVGSIRDNLKTTMSLITAIGGSYSFLTLSRLASLFPNTAR